jgi:pyruvate/2-oxoglutarate dehydrogenase complex dihydrolipoamide acyltransferase (E2) component
VLGEALARALPAGWFQRIARIYRFGAWIALVLIALPFAIEQVRWGIYPALGEHGGDETENVRSVLMSGAAYKTAAAPAPEPEPAQEQAPAVASVSAAAPAAPPPASDKDADGIADEAGLEKARVGGVVSGGGRKKAKGKADIAGASTGALSERKVSAVVANKAPARAQAMAQNLSVYDPNVQVQTGPGVPSGGGPTSPSPGTGRWRATLGCRSGWCRRG